MIRLLLVVVLASSASGGETPLTRIAFGSCCDEEAAEPIPAWLVDLKPDLFLFLGDTVYADTIDPATMRAAYARLGASAGFQRLATTCPLLGTWDDHDYGRDNADATYPMRVEAQRAFCDFWRLSADDARRTRDGVYHAQVFGPEGRRVQVILLDERSFRVPGGTMLGEAQWAWLAQQLAQPAEIRLLCSSVQIVSDDGYDEHWRRWPTERMRLFTTIRRSGAQGVIALSGDRHFAELAREDDAIGYPLYDLTSSPISSPYREKHLPEHDRRIGPAIGRHNAGVVEIDWDARTVALSIAVADGRPLRHVVPLAELQPEQP